MALSERGFTILVSEIFSKNRFPENRRFRLQRCSVEVSPRDGISEQPYESWAFSEHFIYFVCDKKKSSLRVEINHSAVATPSEWKFNAGSRRSEPATQERGESELTDDE